MDDDTESSLPRNGEQQKTSDNGHPVGQDSDHNEQGRDQIHVNETSDKKKDQSVTGQHSAQPDDYSTSNAGKETSQHTSSYQNDNSNRLAGSVAKNTSTKGKIESIVTDNPTGSTSGCQACKTCHGRCCEQGVCARSRNTATQEACCSSEEARCCLFRKSTQLLLSGFFMMGVTGISLADIATDVLTAREYYLTNRFTEFILSLVFLLIPPILLTAGIIRRRGDQIRNKNMSMHCGMKFLIFLLNVPLKLYMIWMQLLFSAKCFRRFHKWRMSGCRKKEEKLLEGSLSHFFTDLTLYKLWNSVFESMPQLLLTINVIMTTPDLLRNREGFILIASSIFSFGSLCVGIIFYAVSSKEAESQPVSQKSDAHPLRSKSTVLGCWQIMFISIFTVCYLSSRAVSLSYFIIFFKWYAVILPGLHFLVVFSFFTHRRCVNKKDTMQHYRLKAYHRQSSSFVYVIVHSFISIFIHVKPEREELLDQPRYYKIIYYMVYTAENCFMIFLPLLLKGIFPGITDAAFEKLMYYPMAYGTVGAMALAAVTCAFYHFVVHKSAKFTREQVFGPCCKCCFGPGGFLCCSCSCCCGDVDESKVYISCKNIYTHEIQKKSLRDIKTWKDSTDSKLLHKKRRWKLIQNAFNDSKRSNEGEEPVERQPYGHKERLSSRKQVENDADYPYTMRRSGLYILCDPKGNLFYAPVMESS